MADHTAAGPRRPGFRLSRGLTWRRWLIDILRRAVGGTYVMREQLSRLAEAARRPNVDAGRFGCCRKVASRGQGFTSRLLLAVTTVFPTQRRKATIQAG
jgi:hypothetical protein